LTSIQKYPTLPARWETPKGRAVALLTANRLGVSGEGPRMSSDWDSEQLLRPISADAPCGENLEDTQLLASFDTYRLFGQTTPFDPAPDWRDIKDSSLKALEKSRDFRLLAHLAAAVLRTDGMVPFFATLKVSAQWLETYWAQVHPLIDEDAILRKNALNSFADRMAIVDGLRRLPLVSNRQLGSFSLRDIDIATGQQALAEGETDKPDESQINAAFAAAPVEDLQQLLKDVGEAIAALQSMDGKMRNEGGSQAAPSFDPLLSVLAQIERLMRQRLALRPEASGAQLDAAESQRDANGVQTVAVGAIKSRQDAIRALDAVSQYFRQNEPSSPIPLFIERAKRLVAKDFLEVLADIAPDALSQAKMAGGVREE
jgi:type VI secretion system protein ImpA